MKKCILIGLLLATLATVAPTTGSARSLDAVYTAYWADRLRLDPIMAIDAGDRTSLALFDSSLEDSWREDMIRTLTAYQNELNDTATSQPAPRERRNVDILRSLIQEDVDYYRSPLFTMMRMLPTDQFQGPHLQFAHDAAGAGSVPFRTVEDYEYALLRSDAFARWVDDAIDRLREGASQGVVLPRLVVERILPQLKIHLDRSAEATEFWLPILSMPTDFSPTDQVRLRDAYRAKITSVIQPAYRRLHHYLQNEYLPKSRATVGIGALPHGDALYRRMVRFHTTSDLSPQEIHELGLKEVERIGKAFDDVRAAVGFKGTRAAFFDRVRNDPALHFSSPEEVIPAYRLAAEQILTHLPDLFGTLPRAPYEIRALPTQSSGTFQGNGNYAAPAADGSRPGILWMNVQAPGVQDRFNVMTISLHEGRPGHHFQASIALEQADLPSFRRSGNYTAYVEGWGLYAESLGREMGLFNDPWQYFGHLSYAILRANRLVIDTGLHAYGWTVDDGVRWMTDHSSMTAEQARAEVERYVAYPGQALAYKIGELKIRELRSRAEEALGERFDVRRYHDRVLRGGPVPLTSLEDDINDFIMSERASP